nr:histidine phosphatase family protein [Pseudaminobacter sp.]
MMPLVYFVRHGQTGWNIEGRLQGQADTDITVVGRGQADRNGRRLAELIAAPEEFDFVASPMRRTRETMERVRETMGLQPDRYRTDARLVEVHFGDWQGHTFVELEAREPGSTKARSKDKWGFVPPGADAESYQMLLE